MKYDIMGKKITSVSGGYNGLNLSFDDGVYVIIKAVAHVSLDSEGKLTVNPEIEVTTDKIELKASEKIEKLPE